MLFTILSANFFILPSKNSYLFNDLGERIIDNQTGDPVTTNDLLTDAIFSLIRSLITVNSEFSAHEGRSETISLSIDGLFIILWILIVLTGSGLITDDFFNLTTEIYFSKMERLDYILSKYGAILLFGNCVIVFPILFDFSLLVVGLGGIDFIRIIPVLIQVIICAEVITITLASVVLAFSAITTRRLYAGLLAFVMLLGGNLVFPLIALNNEELVLVLLLDVLSLLLIFTFIISGTSVVEGDVSGDSFIIDLSSGIGIENWMVLTGLSFFIVLGFLIVVFKVWRTE
jgi:hypothetical protein